jgi:hypothetical protein
VFGDVGSIARIGMALAMPGKGVRILFGVSKRASPGPLGHSEAARYSPSQLLALAEISA